MKRQGPRAVGDLLVSAVPALRDRLDEARLRGAWNALVGPDAEEFLRWPEYRQTDHGVEVDPSKLREHRRESVARIRDLLVTMQERPPFSTIEVTITSR